MSHSHRQPESQPDRDLFAASVAIPSEHASTSRGNGSPSVWIAFGQEFSDRDGRGANSCTRVGCHYEIKKREGKKKQGSSRRLH